MSKPKKISWTARLVAAPLFAGLATFVLIGFFAPDGINTEAAIEPSLTVARPGCDLNAELAALLPGLGENIQNWHFGMPPRDTAQATTYLGSMRVVIRPDTECTDLGDLVRHEHMHLEQSRMDAVGDDFELVADCASQLIGSESVPYVTAAGGCDSTVAAKAAELVQFSKARIAGEK